MPATLGYDVRTSAQTTDGLRVVRFNGIDQAGPQSAEFDIDGFCLAYLRLLPTSVHGTATLRLEVTPEPTGAAAFVPLVSCAPGVFFTQVSHEMMVGRRARFVAATPDGTTAIDAIAVFKRAR